MQELAECLTNFLQETPPTPSRPPRDCTYGVGERMRLSRLLRQYRQNNVDGELWAWAELEYAADQTCFEFKIWMILKDEG